MVFLLLFCRLLTSAMPFCRQLWLLTTGDSSASLLQVQVCVSPHLKDLAVSLARRLSSETCYLPAENNPLTFLYYRREEGLPEKEELTCIFYFSLWEESRLPPKLEKTFELTFDLQSSSLLWELNTMRKERVDFHRVLRIRKGGE